ncbi:MAG: hypothetical protein OXN25_17900 [Candidatus Poribacteria bacterium]|nr:hypothetical protein [Candidatus Poribacteria bacterium]
MLFYYSNLIKRKILEEGREKGRQEGLQEGRQEATREFLSELAAFVEKNGDAAIQQFIEDHKAEMGDGE